MAKCPIAEPQTNPSARRSLDPATDGWSGLVTEGYVCAITILHSLQNDGIKGILGS